MSIEVQAIYNNTLANGTSGDPAKVHNNILSSLKDFYNWTKVTVSTNDINSVTSHGEYYFTDNSYLSVTYKVDNSYYVQVEIITPKETKTIFQGSSFFTFSLGKTSKGDCFQLVSQSSSNTRNNYFFNYYLGDLVLPDGSVAKGCIYLADDNTHYIATDAGISSESTFTSVIDPTRKSFLVPVTDSTTGGVFKDIYLMANSPIQYNKLKIADTGNKYLCGKSICLAD